MNDVRLDSIHGCVSELTACNSSVAGFAHDWSKAAGELKRLEKTYDRMYKAALRTTTGQNADARTAAAHAGVEAAWAELHPDETGISERIEELIGTVEEHKRHFETIERRSSNAQSILAAHRNSQKFEEFIPREAAEMARQAA